MHHGGVTCIDLLRHGEVVTPGLFCAPPDEPLSEKGWQQLGRTTQGVGVAQNGNSMGYHQILSSPSRRCAEFARHLSAELGCELELITGLQEMDFGRWVGQSTKEIWQQDESLLQMLWQSPLGFSAPGGESMVDFSARVQQSWRGIGERFAGQNVLAFTHGGVIRVLLGQALGVPYENILRFELAYGSAVRFKLYADGGVNVYGLGIKRLAGI